MDFAFYRNFITVVETGSISTAAQKLDIVQPALSAQIKTLEKAYGVQLLKMQRGKRHIELTEAGEAFLQQARSLCAAEDKLTLTMQSFSQRAVGTLRFGVSHVRTDYFLRQYLIPFAQAYPEISYQFLDATVEQQQEQLKEGNIDFAFANAPLPASHSFAAIKGLQESFFVVYKNDFPVPWKADEACSSLKVSALSGLPLCCNYGTFPLLRKACEDYSFKPNITFIASTAESALTFAQSGLGLAVIAALRSDTIPPDMRRLQLEHPDLHFEQTLYWSRERRLTPAAELFLDYFQSHRG